MLAVNAPFHPKAVGARVPSYNGYPSSAFVLRDYTTVSSDGSGIIMLAIRPRVKGYMLVGTESSGTISWNGTPVDFPSLSSLESTYSAYRVVGMGIRLKTLLNYQQTGGKLVVCKVPDAGTNTTIGATVSYPTQQSGFYLFPKMESVTANDLLNNDFESSTDMVDISAVDYRAIDVPYNDGWTDLVIFGTGFPASSPCLDAEIVIHVEGLPSSPNVGIAVEAPIMHNAQQLADAVYSSTLKPALQAVSEVTANFSYWAAGTAAAGAAGVAARYLTRGQRRAIRPEL